MTYGSHWSAPDHVFGEEIAVLISTERSGQDYSYNIDFEIWNENQESELKNYFDKSTDSGLESYWY